MNTKLERLVNEIKDSYCYGMDDEKILEYLNTEYGDELDTILDFIWDNDLHWKDVPFPLQNLVIVGLSAECANY